MSNRVRRRRRGRTAPRAVGAGSPGSNRGEPIGTLAMIRGQVRAASRAQQGLLVVRAFFGATFLYAGLDKLIDRAFLDPNSAASIGAQLTAFARASPIALLVRPAEPFAVPIGILIALTEIAIGIGALTGLAFRVAALAGAALSVLFWLTASWTTVPYYYGPDLPYAVG